MDRKCFASGSVTKLFALLLVICLVECATGSCLSYGHSCWGAHGKRSGKPPVSAPDWYLSRLLRRIAANNELTHPKHLVSKNDDFDAIYQLTMPGDTEASNNINENDGTLELPLSRNIEAKPMLDDDDLTKMKMWQIMRESSEQN